MSGGRRFLRWRVATLIAVNVAIVVHLLHGWWAGETFGRVVFADAKAALESGVINPGFLLFALALLVTALFGRLFCGWACHMAALQDLCAWLLQRIGIRPRLFRSRLLGYVPLLLALYLFVWPSVERSIVVPLLARVWPSALAGFDPPPPISGWSLQWTSNNLWAGMPELWVAVPFLLICGSATVYFLGARGLCRYGCPYGGFLRPVEQLAPLRIVVDPDLCDHCALCSAACSLQIRVHEQTRAHGAVLDADCMRTLDCIDACPHQALSLRVATPPLWREAQPAATYDLRLRDEWLIALVALLTLLATRGLYARIPLLLAATLAVIAGFLTWQAQQLARQPEWRFRRLVLRRGGRLSGVGRGGVGALLLLGLLLAQSAALRVILWRAAQIDAQVTVGFEALAAGVDPEQRALAAAATRWYRLAQPLGEGGLALATTPEVPLRLAWLELVQGDCTAATARLARERERLPDDAVVREAAELAAEWCGPLSPRSRP